MSAGAPWSVKGIDPKAREVAKDHARRSGMTLGEWLNRVILEDDIPDEVTTEAQFGERGRSFAGDPGRPRILPAHAPSAQPDLARVAFALDRLTDRIEASETRTGLAISGVEHSVRQALARIESAERAQLAVTARLDETAEVHGERLRRLEADPAGPRSAEALRALEARIAGASPPEAVVDDVLARLAERLAAAEARTAEALEQLKGSLGGLDQRLAAVEGGDAAGTSFKALGQALTHRVEAVRAEVAEKLQAAAGGQVEARLAQMAEHVRVAEQRSARAVDELGRQVLSVAEAVGRKLADVDQRSADAIDQVGGEVARIAGAVEQRLARSERAQSEAFERFSAEVARVTEALAGRPASAGPPEPEPREIDAARAARPANPPLSLSMAGHVAAASGPAAWVSGMTAAGPAGPPPELEPGLEAEAFAQQTRLITETLPPPPEPEPLAAFGPELFSRAEPEPEEDPASETVEAAWRRLDLDVPAPSVPETFAPIAEDDEDLFEADVRPTAGPELSTREVIERARAAARAAQEGREGPQADPRARRPRARPSPGLFGGFGHKPRRQSSALQTALMVAGGAAFLSVGAAGLALMDGAPRPAAGPAIGEQPRAAMALGPASLAPAPGADTTTQRTPAPQPVFAQVRADVEAGVPGALAQLIALAEADHAQAQLYLAQLYDGGEAGLPRDAAQARRFTARSAENGEAQAMHNLGVYFFRGEGGPQDLESAAHWFRKAAAAGVVESQYNLGLLYQAGSGVEQDLAEARRWFGQAAAKGDPEARRALAQLDRPAASASR